VFGREAALSEGAPSSARLSLAGLRRSFASDRLVQTAHAFDSVAATYDASNAGNPLLRAMRERTLAAILRELEPHSKLLDLGCGPGADAETLARDGHLVVGIDSAVGMVREAQARISRACLDGRVRIRHLGIHEISRLDEVFDVAYSNFGPLNCVPDLEPVAREIAHRLRAGGRLIASVIGRVCPWELLVYGLRRDWRRARVRFTPGVVPVPLNGGIVWTRYYRPREFEEIFRRAAFKRQSLRALGLLSPPPYLQAFAERHPVVIAGLAKLENMVAGWPALRDCGDHFLMVLEKRG
jgi:SAM-dependent methyltransferase